MFTGSSIQYSSSKSRFLAARRWILLATFVFLALLVFARPDSSSSRPSTHQASPFNEAENLLAQGRIAEAREKTLHELEQNPKSVEGLNLLGIIDSSAKDYAGARDAFERALKLDPRSTRTHNNLGSLDVTEGKSELAKK